nr:hypothetical protein [Oscillospiraceae bacterium]
AAFIRAFRAFASVIHSYAPSAAVVWAPNSFPGYNIPDYYPGDEYVDIVGISLYMSYRPELNPLGNGVENRRWIDEIDTIYALYGARKPIMVTEGAVSLATAGGLDLSSFAAAQLQDFFLYLPIRYPNVKFMVWFDAADTVGNDVYRCLTSNATVLRAYRAALTGNKSVLSSVKAAAAPVYYGRLLTGSGVADGPVTLCTYVKGVTPIARVSYAVNGVALGTCTTAPYEITADFSAYRGTRVRVTVSSYYADGTQAGEDGFTLCVEGMAPSGTAYAREQTVILDGKPVTLSAYAVKNAKGYETNYVSVRELATTLRGTPGQYDVVWNKAAKVISITTGRTYSAADETPLTGDRTYCVNPAQTLINGTVENLSSIVIKDWQGGGHCYYKLRDLGEALGIEVVWSHGIYINTAAQ